MRHAPPLAALVGIAIIAPLAALVGVACGPTDAQLAERERCYAAAESAAQERVDRECPDLFTTCAHASAIMADLQREQERCP
jgi:hypothetical protein